MTTRALRESDIPALQRMAEMSGYPYPALDGPLIEAVSVVVDDDDQPVMAVAAKRLVELYLYVSPMPPAAKLAALKLLHHSMAQSLAGKGYNCAEAYIPPILAKSFGRRLEKFFQWKRNWPSWYRRF